MPTKTQTLDFTDELYNELYVNYTVNNIENKKSDSPNSYDIFIELEESYSRNETYYCIFKTAKNYLFSEDINEIMGNSFHRRSIYIKDSKNSISHDFVIKVESNLEAIDIEWMKFICKDGKIIDIIEINISNYEENNCK